MRRFDLERKDVKINVPVWQWRRCYARFYVFVRGIPFVEQLKQFSAAKWIATDDPRLKEK